MAEESVLSDDFLRQLINVGQIDLLVAVPTYNDSKTIAGVVQAVRSGLLKHFPRERAVLINTDLNSRDETSGLAVKAARTLPPELALHSLRTFHTLTVNCGNENHRAAVLRPVLAAADLLQARACAVIAPSANVTPDRMEQLLAPVYRRSFDLVAPRYRRHKFDGLLVKMLLYPMMRSIWGKRVHEPHGSDFGFSGRFGAELLAQNDIWQDEAGANGEELLLSMTAAMNGYRMCEVFLGVKEHFERATDLVAAMRQTVGTMFHFVSSDASGWQSIQGSEPLPLEGGSGAEIDSESLSINAEHLHSMFQLGVTELHSVLASILTEKTLSDLTCCAGLSRDVFRFPDDLWARIVYEFAAGYRKAVISRDHIIQALVPVYRGKACDFLITNSQAAAPEVEARIEALCLAFENTKPHLVQLWNGHGGGIL